MRILNAIYQLKSQRSLLARAPGRHPVNGAHILSVTVLALLTSCTIELKPDKVPGGITGNNVGLRPITYPRPTPADPVQVYPGSLTSMDGGYGLGPAPQLTAVNR
jgi:hypothetical protein